MPSPADPVLDYHRRSKHRFDAYAPGPETLDWEAQPEPFRNFAGAAQIALPGLPETLGDPALTAALRRPLAQLAEGAALPATLSSLSVLLQLACGITAWKSFGPDRWAVRANPSSGNLHPVEVYLVMRGIPGFSDGVYHYRPDTHALECRATCPASEGAPQLLAGISSVMWREAWKYGERAFRYCQLDTGHAVGALGYAAALLGWPCREQALTTRQLGRLLGLDRSAEFAGGRAAYTEREEPEILLSLLPGETDVRWLEGMSLAAVWHGIASNIDRHPMYRWEAIDEIAAATQRTDTGVRRATHPAAAPALQADLPPAAQLILQRRSAQRFDARHVMPQADFYAMLSALLPTAAPPWDTLAGPPRIGLVLFVHRVEGLVPGLYLLPRATTLDETCRGHFRSTPVENAPEPLRLQCLASAAPAELHRLSRSLHCHQDIASTGCFAVGMLAEFNAPVSTQPSLYRDLYREAGLIGQALYLHAEAHGLRGTGIGCYFDDPFHALLGFQDARYQSVYHFTVGLPLEDPRIVTTINDTMRLPS